MKGQQYIIGFIAVNRPNDYSTEESDFFFVQYTCDKYMYACIHGWGFDKAWYLWA